MATPLLTRRNGRPQACEPCRKRKVACDHAQPICRRCIKRKQDSSCVYLVSDPASSASTPKPPRPSNAGRVPTRDAPLRRDPPARPVSPDTPSSGATVGGDPGYLGFTSFCTIYEETEKTLNQMQGSGQAALEVSPRCDSSVTGAEEARQIIMSSYVRDMGLTVLRQVPDPHQGEEMFNMRETPLDAWVGPLAQRIMKSLYETLGDYFRPDANPAHLEVIARKLCENTRRPISDNETDPDQWIAQFVGGNLRWESFGILFIFWDVSRMALTEAERKAMRRQRTDCKGWTSMNRECLGLCLELCMKLAQGNSMILYMTYRVSIAESFRSGDASLATWRYNADTIAMLTFLGFHAEKESTQYKPCLTSEIKRKLFCIAYIINLVGTSFTGRPPLVNRRYHTTPLPLDLPDDDTMMNPQALAKAVEDLDKNGWNQKGQLNSATTTRARMMIACIREDIFEIALGRQEFVPMETLLQLKAREMEAFSQFPKLLHHVHTDLEDWNVPIRLIYTRLIVQLEHLQNLFFIERLLSRHGQTDKKDLLTVSYDLVTLTLPYWTHMDRLSDMRPDCEWLVMAYGAPAGGILCDELLQPTLRAPLTISEADGSRIGRSSIIQKLSLLVGFLDWVRPSAPNGDLCMDCKRIIRHVLDQTLNFGEDAFQQPGFLDELDWDWTQNHLDFNFDLLDTFDWLRQDNLPSSQAAG